MDKVFNEETLLSEIERLWGDNSAHADIYRSLLSRLKETLPQDTQPKKEVNTTCPYEIAWVGVCKKPADESGFCEDHKKEKCCSCGDQATHSCCETMGLVCGFPLCDNCEHTIQDNGCNSGGNLPERYKMHYPKDKQIYKPWYLLRIT